MTDAQQRAAAKAFADYWRGKGYEKGESQAFWLSLLRDVYAVEHPEQFITFEEQVHLDHTSFIDGTIPSTHVRSSRPPRPFWTPAPCTWTAVWPTSTTS